jgi:hypothetical protein
MNADCVAMLSEPAIKERYVLLGISAAGRACRDECYGRRAVGADHQGGEYSRRMMRVGRCAIGAGYRGWNAFFFAAPQIMAMWKCRRDRRVPI